MRAKFKSRIIIILATILGGIFAFTCGSVYGAYTHTISINSNPNTLANVYTVPQSYSIINDTVTSPIPFSAGAHNCNVGIKLSYTYAVDVRIKYSLEWSNGNSTDNVILNFVDRDNLLVDNQYIYLVYALDTTTCNFISGVDFVDIYDTSYYGATLKINIDEVKVYKYTSPTVTPLRHGENHPLVKGINSPAAEAYARFPMQYDNNKTWVMVYNHRADYAHGIEHPGAVTAYRKTLDSSNNITNMTKLYGNTNYAGIGMYVIAEKETTLSVRVTGTWLRADGETGSGVIFDNNIKMNYSSDWAYADFTYDDSCDYGTFNYKYKITQGSYGYIDLVDSIEVTLRNTLEQTDYTGYRLVVSGITINGTTFDNFTDGIQCGEIADGTLSITNTQNFQSDTYTITNSTKYHADLFDSGRAEASAQTFPTNINVENHNVDKHMKVTAVTLKLKYYRSNGQSTQYIDDGVYDYNFDGVYWYREENTVDSSYISASPKLPIIAPYSSANILDEYTVNAKLKDLIGNYDVWVELVVEISYTYETGFEANNLDLNVEPTLTNNNNNATISFNVKNNSQDRIANNLTAKLALEIYTPVISSVSADISAAEWSGTYWKYYYQNSTGEYVRNQNPERNSSTTYYIVTYSWQPITINSYTLSDLFTNNSGNFTTTTMLPNQTLNILSFRTSIGSSYKIDGSTTRLLRFKCSTTFASAEQATSGTRIINSGTPNAYIVNFNTSGAGYFFRFAGNISSTSLDIIKVGNYNYYIGIVRPCQIIRVENMTSGDDFDYTCVELPAGGKNPLEAISDWPSEVLDAFNRLLTKGVK